MGLDIGLIDSGLRVDVGQELDKRAVETILANGHQVVPGDLRALLAHDPSLSSMLSHSPSEGEPFAVVGGPPCQPF